MRARGVRGGRDPVTRRRRPGAGRAVKRASPRRSGEEAGMSSAAGRPRRSPAGEHVYSGEVRELYVPDESRLSGSRPSTTTPSTARAPCWWSGGRISAFDQVLHRSARQGHDPHAAVLWWCRLTMPTTSSPRTVHESMRGRASCADLFHVPRGEHGAQLAGGCRAGGCRATGAVCGRGLPEGLQDGDRLDTRSRPRPAGRAGSARRAHGQPGDGQRGGRVHCGGPLRSCTLECRAVAERIAREADDVAEHQGGVQA
ncbi:hypothetical protein QJS66_18330 [Kocuria rhizophila]|nr:hypothetical protein QJS66_18330 [Kocuria rhizophila]